MVEQKLLRKIGLTDNEISVYLALLKVGESLASKVAEEINLNRTHCYDVLESLAEKGLISYIIKANKKHFRAASPNKILDYLAEKEHLLEKQKKEIQKLLPDLLALKKPLKEETKAEIFKGPEGIKTIYSDILRTAKEYYVLGATGQIAEFLQYYFPAHETQRVKKKIKLKLLFNVSLKGTKITRRKFAEIRFLPEKFSSPIPTTIYNNKVVILIWTEPLAIVIKNKEVADTYKSYFKLLWEIARK